MRNVASGTAATCSANAPKLSVTTASPGENALSVRSAADDARGFPAERERGLLADLELAAAHQQVGEADARGVDVDDKRVRLVTARGGPPR